MNTNTIEITFQDTPQLWQAIRPNEYDGAPDSRSAMGHGKTPIEAAANLLEHEIDLADIKAWPVTECRCMYGLGGSCTHCDSRLKP